MDSHHHHEPVRAEPDLIPVAPVLIGVAIIILTFLIGIFWSYKLQRREEARHETAEDSPAPAPLAFKYEVGIINSEQFDSETRAYTLQSQQRNSLNEYGWANRSQNLAYVPIEEGIRKVTAQYGGK